MHMYKFSTLTSAHLARPMIILMSTFENIVFTKGPDTPDAIRQRNAIFRFSLTDNFDPSLNFLNI
jgi:hypothetical protein